MYASAGSALVAVPAATICPNVGFTVVVSLYVVCARPRMFAWLNMLNPSILSRIDRGPVLMRPSRKNPTSWVAVPRKADLAMTFPST